MRMTIRTDTQVGHSDPVISLWNGHRSTNKSYSRDKPFVPEGGDTLVFKLGELGVKTPSINWSIKKAKVKQYDYANLQRSSFRQKWFTTLKWERSTTREWILPIIISPRAPSTLFWSDFENWNILISIDWQLVKIFLGRLS